MLRAAAIFAVLVLAAPVRADEASGTWTGAVTLRANYYWETSTRVVAPEVSAALVSPDGTRVEADYLVDAITSASVASGVQEDIRFTEIRHQVTAGVSHEFDLGDMQLRLGTNARVSLEPDYVATWFNFSSQLSLNQRNTVLGITATYIHDDVGAVLRGGMPRIDPTTGRDLSDRGRQGQLEGVALLATWSQVLSPVDTLVLGYQSLYDAGYLANPYRQRIIGGGPHPETHPPSRYRHTLFARIAHFFPQTQTAIHLMARAYIDDWSIGSLTPEVRLYQMLGPSVLLRLRYRFNTQSESFFAMNGDMSDAFITADPKMTAFDSHLVGGQIRVLLDFLDPTPLSFLARGSLDVSFNYWFQTSRFGDAILAQAGLTTPF